MNELKIFGLVYATINIKNNKVYIGQTIRINNNDYIGSGSRFLEAVKKHGRNYFCSYLLQYAYSREELDLLEKQYIESFNSCDPKLGYNLAMGGRGKKNYSKRPSKKSDISNKEMLQYLKSCKSSQGVIQKEWGMHHGQIQKIMRSKYNTASIKKVISILS